MNEEKLKSILESLLFVSGEPIKISRLARISGVGKNEIEESLDAIEKDYKEQNKGLRIVKKGDSVQLATNPENAEFVSQLVSGEMSSELSKSALETLSVAAYRGPVTRIQIEAIRGVNCSYVLRSLLMRGLVERKESSDIRGYLYEISFDFLKILGIQNPKEFPDWESLSRNEKVEELLKEDEQEV